LQFLLLKTSNLYNNLFVLISSLKIYPWVNLSFLIFEYREGV